MMQDQAFTHLPADIAAALADYDARAASGTLTYDAEGFAAHTADPRDGWIAGNVRDHVSAMDVSQ